MSYKSWEDVKHNASMLELRIELGKELMLINGGISQS